LGVSSVTAGVVVNAIPADYGSAWAATGYLVGYMHVFSKAANPGVVL